MSRPVGRLPAATCVFWPTGAPRLEALSWRSRVVLPSSLRPRAATEVQPPSPFIAPSSGGPLVAAFDSVGSYFWPTGGPVNEGYPVIAGRPQSPPALGGCRGQAASNPPRETSVAAQWSSRRGLGGHSRNQPHHPARWRPIWTKLHDASGARGSTIAGVGTPQLPTHSGPPKPGPATPFPAPLRRPLLDSPRCSDHKMRAGMPLSADRRYPP
jgi:hypothetical protein